MKLSSEELAAHWMPFTSNRDFKANPRLIQSANGVYFKATDGRQVFDGLSGLWTCGAGHGREEITKAVSKQLAELDYSPGFQFGHALSFKLAKKIVDLTPEGLDRVFFTSSGSESVDTALKIAKGYWRLRGQPGKSKFIGRAKGYHGVNFGGIGVGGIGFNRKLFGQTIDSDHITHTLLPENKYARGQPESGAHLANELEELIALHDASNIAAVIVEPMAGSSGVLPPPKGYLDRLREICTRNNILLIFDEVITGFGRVGSLTAAEEFGVTPDIMTLAKQITNGTVPLGAVVASNEIYNAYMDNGGPNYMVELPHGYTYSAHPVACAAGLAALDILVNDELIERVRDIAPIFEEAVHSLKGSQFITDIRNYGLAAGITLQHYENESLRLPYEIGLKCFEKGFYVRWGGDTLQIAPPFISNRDQIDSMVNAIGESLDECN